MRHLYVLFTLIVVVYGVDLFVSNSGTSSSHCGDTLENSCKNLRDATSQITNEMITVTINIEPGIYSGIDNFNITLNTPNTKITIQSLEQQSGDNEVLFACNENYSIFIKQPYYQNLTINGISIMNCDKGIDYGKSSSNIVEFYLTLQKVKITNGFEFINANYGNLLAENTYFGYLISIADEVYYWYQSTGIKMVGPGNMIIKSCIFENTMNGLSINTQSGNLTIDSTQFHNFGELSLINSNNAQISNCNFSTFTANNVCPYMLNIGNSGNWDINNCNFTNFRSNITSKYGVMLSSAAINIRNANCKFSNLLINTNANYSIYCSFCALQLNNSFISNSDIGIYLSSYDYMTSDVFMNNVQFNNCLTSSIELMGTTNGVINNVIQSFSLSNSKFSNSGRIYANGAYVGRISDSSFTKTLDEERAILIKGIGEWFFNNISVYENSFPGGINIHYSDAKASFSNCNFYNNTGDNGAAIYFEGSVINVDNCYFDSNYANDFGGAIYLKDGICNVDDSTFINNSATSGPAIYCSSGTINTNDNVNLIDNSSDSGNDITCGASLLRTIIMWLVLTIFLLFVIIGIVLLIVRFIYL